MNTEIIQAIPTEYRGHRFRSRLEAKWACFFDNCGWPWEYEPLDLNGYIPDFILTFDEPMLVEVKPALSPLDFDGHWKKIHASGWSRESLIVGAKIFRVEEIDRTGGWEGCAAIGAFSDDMQDVAAAVLQTCGQCKRISFFHSYNSWACRRCPVYRGDEDCNPFSYEEGRSLFAECSGVVQYNA